MLEAKTSEAKMKRTRRNSNRGFTMVLGFMIGFGPAGGAEWRPKSLYDSLGSGARWFLDWPLFRVGNIEVTPIFLIKCAVFLAALSLLTKLSKRFLAKRILARTKIERGHQYAIGANVRLLRFPPGTHRGPQLHGAQLSSLLVVGGALGVGVGLGLQNVVANFVAGLVIRSSSQSSWGTRSKSAAQPEKWSRSERAGRGCERTTTK